MSGPAAQIVVRVPGSKSEAIRALVLAALAPGTGRVTGTPASRDVAAVVGALRGLGIVVEGEPGPAALVVRGCGGALPGGDRTVRVGGSATGLRILACVAALRQGRTLLDGNRSLRARPAGPLAAALAPLGVRVRTRRGRPPVVVEGGPSRGAAGTVGVDAARTSQVASGLLVAGAALPGGIRVRLEGTAVSRRYLDLTVEVLRRAGVSVRRTGDEIHVREGIPRAPRLRVEPDWSSAAYPLLGAALRGVRVRVPDLPPRSAQADRAVLGVLRAAGVRCGVDAAGAWAEGGGALRPFSADLRDAPDLAPVAAALALFAPGESRVTGAAHLRAKESDRIASCVAAARALGAGAEGTADGFVIRGGTPRAGAVDPRGDHRIALAFSLAAAAIPGARVGGTACVAKSWPGALRAMAPLLGRGPAHSSGGSGSAE